MVANYTGCGKPIPIRTGWFRYDGNWKDRSTYLSGGGGTILKNCGATIKQRNQLWLCSSCGKRLGLAW